MNMEIRETDKMKKIITLFSLLITFMFTCLVVQAKGNYLHSITLEKGNDGYNVILNTDKITKVVRRTNSDNELTLEISDIKTKETINALYKGTNNIDNLVIENNEPNKLKVYITAPNIKSSSIIIEPVDGQAALAGETIPTKRILWCTFVMVLFAGIFISAKRISENDSKIIIKKDIKDREIEMYRKYKKSFDTSMNLKNSRDMKMRSMIKKIDRKIDERLTAIR